MQRVNGMSPTFILHCITLNLNLFRTHFLYSGAFPSMSFLNRSKLQQSTQQQICRSHYDNEKNTLKKTTTLIKMTTSMCR